MKGIACLFGLAALGVACAAAPPPPSVEPVKPAPPAAPVTLPLPPETPDASFRYVPPALGVDEKPGITVEEAHLSNGMPVRFAAMRASPVIAALVSVRWKAVPKIAGTAVFLGESLRRAKLASGRALDEELRDLGATMTTFTTQDATYLRLVTLPDLMEPALALMIAALRTGKLEDVAADRMRKALLKDIEIESPLTKLDRSVDEQLFAAGHPYHEASAGTAESLKKLKAADLARFRDSALGPDGVSFAVCGSASMSEVTAALERVAGSWKPAPAAKSKDAEPPGPAHGVFLVEQPDDHEAHVMVTMPMPMPGQADYPAALVAWEVWTERSLAGFRSGSQTYRWRTTGKLRMRRHGTALEWLAEVDESNAANAIVVALRAIDEVVKGSFSDMELAFARRWRSGRVTLGDGLDPLLWSIGIEETLGSPPGKDIALAAAVGSVPRDEVVRAAGSYLKKDRLSVVVTGAAALEKAAFEKLGLGPVKVVLPAKKGAKP